MKINNIHVRLLPAILSVASFMMLVPGLNAQQEEIDKQVVVVRTYEPSIANASKINLLPTLADTISVTPVFSYSILPIPLTSDIKVETIIPARISAETVTRLYRNHLRLGMGSYFTPYGELSINSIRNNRYSGGMFLRHHSSQGRLRLDNDAKAISQFGDNEMHFFGKRMGRRNVLSGEAGLVSNAFHYYGHDTSIDTVLLKDDLRQRFITGNAGLRMHSTHTDSAHLNYDLSFGYRYFQDRLDVSEHGLGFKAGFNKFIRSQVIGADFGIDYFDNTINPAHSNLVLRISPWFNKADDEWEVFAGFHGYYDHDGEESALYFHPRASLQFSLIRDYVVPYVGLDGDLRVNNHSRIARENPFILPGVTVRNTDRNMDLNAGVKGNFTRNVSFNLGVSYAVYNNMYFFVNDDGGLIGNQFNVVYDNIELLTYKAEIGANFNNRFSLFARANFYDYGMKELAHPWHKPELDMAFSAKYNMGNKILLNADVFYIGSRYANSLNGADPVKLDGITDVNLGIEYRYNRVLSGFLRLNNLTNARYYKWNNYPMQGFSLMGGFTYSM